MIHTPRRPKNIDTAALKARIHLCTYILPWFGSIMHNQKDDCLRMTREAYRLTTWCMANLDRPKWQLFSPWRPAHYSTKSASGIFDYFIGFADKEDLVAFLLVSGFRPELVAPDTQSAPVTTND
jgi:hypothetical protein